MTTVLYTVVGEEGDDASHPNSFSFAAPRNRALTVSDIVVRCPYPGDFRWQFRVAAPALFGPKPSAVWRDASGGGSPPLYEGQIVARLTRVFGGDSPTSAAAAAPSQRRQPHAAVQASDDDDWGDFGATASAPSPAEEEDEWAEHRRGDVGGAIADVGKRKLSFLEHAARVRRHRREAEETHDTTVATTRGSSNYI